MFRLKKAYRQVSSSVELSTIQSPSGPAKPPSLKLPWRQQHLHGWRIGVLSGASLATTVLILNLAITVAASRGARTGGNDDDSGRRLLFEGDCKKSERLNVVAHLLINVMSTILLSASNYAMQCLSAPTRFEIDIAHSKKKSLDVGVLSVRNIQSISIKRAILWACLGLSSLPLHLLYNSAVFSTVTSYDYTIFSARADMFDATSTSDAFVAAAGVNTSALALTMFDKFKSGDLERLSASQCIDAYATTFQAQRRNVVLVTDDNNSLPQARNFSSYDASISPGTSGCISDPFEWICGRDSSVNCLSKGEPLCSAAYKDINRDDWSPLGNKVDHCLSEQVPGHCKVQFSVTIAYVVVVFNFCKAAILFSVIFLVNENPLTTMGDAVSSFLISADDTTSYLCLMSRDRLNLWKLPPVPQRYTRGLKKDSRLWLNTVSRTRWWFCIFLYSVAIITCISLLIYGLVRPDVPASVLMSLPLGALNPSSFIFRWGVPTSGSSGVIGNALVANSPQVILSTIYYTYNSMFTCFFAGREWSQYATHRKGLRVSSRPRGQQRSTYFLQLPYKIAVPLMVLSGILHWLTSQSIFLVSIEQTREGDAEILGGEFLTCGYSPPAILSVILLGMFMVAAVVYFGRKKFEGGMPIVATSSACISAMCHLSATEKETDTAYRAVKWGVTDENADDSDKKDTITHCSFSSLHVRLPEEGELCAGFSTSVSRKDE